MTVLRQTIALPRALPGFSRVMLVLLDWRAKWTTRNALARLDAHLCDDIGLSPRDAGHEARKPFWLD